jgi:hypothetical protein
MLRNYVQGKVSQEAQKSAAKSDDESAGPGSGL